MKSQKKLGFTLLEIMVIVAIFGIISGIVMQKFGDVAQKTKEGRIKANLGLVRSALNIYFSDNLAWFPTGDVATSTTTLTTSLLPKYLNDFPEIEIRSLHAETESIDNVDTSTITTDNGHWAYVSVYADNDWGKFLINCTHSDTDFIPFSAY